jgi:hypothetical protein
MIRYYCDICDKEIINKDDSFSLNLRRNSENNYMKADFQYKNIFVSRKLEASMVCDQCSVSIRKLTVDLSKSDE